MRCQSPTRCHGNIPYIFLTSNENLLVEILRLKDGNQEPRPGRTWQGRAKRFRGHQSFFDCTALSSELRMALLQNELSARTVATRFISSSSSSIIIRRQNSLTHSFNYVESRHLAKGRAHFVLTHGQLNEGQKSSKKIRNFECKFKAKNL